MGDVSVEGLFWWNFGLEFDACLNVCDCQCILKIYSRIFETETSMH